MLFLLAQKLAREIWFAYLHGVKTPINMSNHIPDFNGFPTDNSSSTNLKYDIITSKFMTGIQNHQMRTAQSPSVGIVLGLIVAVGQMVLALVVMLIFGVRLICKKT